MSSSLWMFIVLAMVLSVERGLPSLSSAEDSSPQGGQPELDALMQRYEGFLEVCRGLAIYDWPAMLDLVASPDVRRQWETQYGELFSRHAASRVFFSHSFMLVAGQSRERWTGGLYNLWVDQWLMLDFVWHTDSREYRLAGLSLFPGGNGEDLAAVTDAAAMERYLRERFADAISTGYALAQSLQAPEAAGAQAKNQVSTQTVSAHVRTYMDRLIGAFSKAHDETPPALRTAATVSYTHLRAHET